MCYFSGTSSFITESGPNTTTEYISADPTTIDDNEILLLNDDEIEEDEDIPVSYHNSLILNQVC